MNVTLRVEVRTIQGAMTVVVETPTGAADLATSAYKAIGAICRAANLSAEDAKTAQAFRADYIGVTIRPIADSSGEPNPAA